MRRTIFDELGQRLAAARNRLLVSIITSNLRRLLMNLGILDGFKTYIVAAAMVLAALGQLVGVDIPSFDGHAAGQLLMEGLAILFLRKGMKAGA
ncbi:MAG: hypothetical protein ACTHLT_12330 [Devosia sp.]